MSEKAKTIVGEIFPRWATMILIGICAVLLKAEIDLNKQTREVVNKLDGDVRILQKSDGEMFNAVKQLSELNRLLELRVTRMEAGNEARKL